MNAVGWCYHKMTIYSQSFFTLERIEQLSYVRNDVSRDQSTYHAGNHCSGGLEKRYIFLFVFNSTPLLWHKKYKCSECRRVFCSDEDGRWGEDLVEELGLEGYRWKKMGRWTDRKNNLKQQTGMGKLRLCIHPYVHPFIHPSTIYPFIYCTLGILISPLHECVNRWWMGEETRQNLCRV